MIQSTIRYTKGFLLATMLFAGISQAGAQHTELGVRFMPTFSSLQMKTSTGGDFTGAMTVGYGGGIFGGYHFNDHVGVQAEIIYNSISQKFKENDVEREITLRYLNIPLLFSLNSGKSKPVNFNVVAGPQMGLSVGSTLSASVGEGPDHLHAQLGVKKSDIGFAYGAGVDFGLNAAKTFRLGIGFRGVYGLFDISDNSHTVVTDSYFILDHTHIRTYSGYIGLSFLL